MYRGLHRARWTQYTRSCKHTIDCTRLPVLEMVVVMMWVLQVNFILTKMKLQLLGSILNRILVNFESQVENANPKPIPLTL